MTRVVVLQSGQGFGDRGDLLDLPDAVAWSASMSSHVASLENLRREALACQRSEEAAYPRRRSGYVARGAIRPRMAL